MPNDPDAVSLEAIVTAWTPAAMRDHFDGGGFAVYDAVTLTLTSPPEHAGRDLSLLIEQPVPDDSLWRNKGALICFEMRPTDLVVGRKLFGGAARNPRPC